MKKISLILTTLTLLAIFVILPVLSDFAQAAFSNSGNDDAGSVDFSRGKQTDPRTVWPHGERGPGFGPNPSVDVIRVLEKIVDWLFYILLIVSALAIVIAGYLFVTAAGDADKVSKARNFVIYALIGVAVAFLARGLIALVSRMINIE